MSYFARARTCSELVTKFSLAPSPPPPSLRFFFCAVSPCARMQVKTFFEKNPVPNNARKLSQMLESMEINVRFFKTIANSPLSTDAFWEGLEM